MNHQQCSVWPFFSRCSSIKLEMCLTSISKTKYQMRFTVYTYNWLKMKSKYIAKTSQSTYKHTYNIIKILTSIMLKTKIEMSSKNSQKFGRLSKHHLDLADILSSIIYIFGRSPDSRIQIYQPDQLPDEVHNKGFIKNLRISLLKYKEDYWQNLENFFFQGGHFWRAKSIFLI